MRYLPLAISIILITIIGIVIGFFVINLAKKDSSIVQSSVKSLQTENALSSHSLVPIHSNQWYSSIYKDFPSSPLYAFPLAFKIDESGLGFSFPTVDFKEKTVFGIYNEDFTIGFDNKISKPTINSIGDWSINLKLRSEKDEEMDIFLGHGFPYSIINVKGSDIILKSKKDIKFYQGKDIKSQSQKEISDSIVVNIENNYYVLFFNNNLNLSYDKNSLKIEKPNKIFIALLDKIENFNVFEKHKDDLITNTKATYSITENSVLTNFEIENKSESSLIALFPHQSDFLNEKSQILGQYETLRGNLKLIDTKKSFTTSIKLEKPSKSFLKSSINESAIKKQIIGDINNLIKSEIPESRNYYMGTWIGMTSSLMQLADTYNLPKEKERLLNFIQPIFEESLTHYVYDESKTSLISTKPEFGNEELNDHHFHYSYYIRLGAILIDSNLNLNSESLRTLNEMVKDIANSDRSVDQFPYIRSFDVYESHSWADGFGDSNDGNNQESTSEAINAWYSVYLWGIANDNKDIEELGLALYNSEINSALYYWFDKNKIYKEPYDHRIASIVWGGKVDFATWFSPKVNMIYGIQLLPFTPASNYLSKLTNFIDYENDFKKSGGSESEEWGDLYLMLKSYHSNVDLSDIPKEIKSYDRNPKSLLLHIISANQDNF